MKGMNRVVFPGTLLLLVGCVIGWIVGTIGTSIRYQKHVEISHEFYQTLSAEYQKGHDLQASLRTARLQYDRDNPQSPRIDGILLEEDGASAVIRFHESSGYFYLGVWKEGDSLTWSVSK